MKSQAVKSIYYLTVGKLSIVSYFWNRMFAERYRDRFVQIGSGPDYIEGMINVDGNIFRKKDIWLDITLGLPFADNSIAGVYASHIMEHFNVRQVRRILGEYYRALKPGATLRIVAPSLEFAIQAYTRNRPSDMPQWPEAFSSMGGRFNNFLLRANQHRLMFDFSFIEELSSEAGFQPIWRGKACQSGCFQAKHMAFERRWGLDRSLYVEALKPSESVVSDPVTGESSRQLSIQINRDSPPPADGGVNGQDGTQDPAGSAPDTAVRSEQQGDAAPSSVERQ